MLNKVKGCMKNRAFDITYSPVFQLVLLMAAVLGDYRVCKAALLITVIILSARMLHKMRNV